MHAQHSNPPSLPNAHLHVGLQGFFKIEAKQPDGTVRVLADWFPNLITDIGLNRWGTGGIVSFCGVGTGTAQPTVTDTGLTAPLAFTGSFTTAADTAQSTAPYFITLARTFTFTQGAVVGNISEVSVGWAGANGSAWSHARIKDGGGVDTTITVTAIEQLSVSYQLRLNIVTPDVVTTPTIGGVVTTVTLRPSQVTAAAWSSATGGNANGFDTAYAGSTASSNVQVWNGTIGAVTGSPSGTSGGSSSSIALGTYSNNSLFNDVTYNFSISTGNPVGGISAAKATQNVAGMWQCSFSPAIAKDNTKTLSLTFRYSWART